VDDKFIVSRLDAETWPVPICANLMHASSTTASCMCFYDIHVNSTQWRKGIPVCAALQWHGLRTRITCTARTSSSTYMCPCCIQLCTCTHGADAWSHIYLPACCQTTSGLLSPNRAGASLPKPFAPKPNNTHRTLWHKAKLFLNKFTASETKVHHAGQEGNFTL
jgi:hypothetical protein